MVLRPDPQGRPGGRRARQRGRQRLPDDHRAAAQGSCSGPASPGTTRPREPTRLWSSTDTWLASWTRTRPPTATSSRLQVPRSRSGAADRKTFLGRGDRHYQPGHPDRRRHGLRAGIRHQRASTGEWVIEGPRSGSGHRGRPTIPSRCWKVATPSSSARCRRSWTPWKRDPEARLPARPDPPVKTK